MSGSVAQNIGLRERFKSNFPLYWRRLTLHLCSCVRTPFSGVSREGGSSRLYYSITSFLCNEAPTQILHIPVSMGEVLLHAIIHRYVSVSVLPVKNSRIEPAPTMWSHNNNSLQVIVANTNWTATGQSEAITLPMNLDNCL